MLYLLLLYLCLGISVASLAVAVLALYTSAKRQRIVRETVLSREVYGSRHYRRTKRYILFRFVCFDSIDLEEFAKRIVSHIYAALGPTMRMKCGLALVTVRPDLGRGIIRVSGDPACVKHVLAAMSIRHIVDGIPCLIIPVRTSGLVSRLRKYLKVYSLR